MFNIFSNCYPLFKGIPEEHSKKLAGTHWEMKCCVVGKKVFASQTCCEHPEYNMCGMYIEGVENVIPCMPGLGGKVCIIYEKAHPYTELK